MVAPSVWAWDLASPEFGVKIPTYTVVNMITNRKQTAFVYLNMNKSMTSIVWIRRYVILPKLYIDFFVYDGL